MFDAGFSFINEEFYAEGVSPEQLDELLANGWRHFGTHFFRYNLGLYEFDIRRVIPLRIRLADFTPTKSQRRVLKRNSDLRTHIGPIEITDEIETIFDRHKTRFGAGRPESIYDFLSPQPAVLPGEANAIYVFKGDELLAASFFDIGRTATSGIYAIFEPKESDRGLGIFTMLKEIEFAIASDREFYYQGYSYEGESFYDYKKRFRGTEGYDWNGRWSSEINIIEK